MRNRYDQWFKNLGIDSVLDLDFDEDDIDAYHIGDILPVVIIYDNDKEILRIVGEKSKKELNKIFENLPLRI